MIWERVPGGRKAWFTDVHDVGRYLIRWVKDDSVYRAYLNGKRTIYSNAHHEVLMRIVEDVATNREKGVTVSITELVEAPNGNRRRPPPDMEEFAEEIYKQAQHYAADERHIVLTDVYLAIESCARKCAELERRVKELEDRYERDDHRS